MRCRCGPPCPQQGSWFKKREREMAEGTIESRRETLQFCQVPKGTDWNRKNLEMKWNDNGKYNTEATDQMQINVLSPLSYSVGDERLKSPYTLWLLDSLSDDKQSSPPTRRTDWMPPG